MSKTITGLGPREAEFLSKGASENGGEFAIEYAAKFWGSGKMARKKLYDLQKRGWITRVERGKYFIVPLEAGPSRQWSQDTYAVAAALVQPASIAYWSAIRHWNWTEQIPQIVYVQTTARKSRPRRIISGVQYDIVTVSSRQFYGNIKEWRNGKPVLVTAKEKTLVDCADDVGRAGGIEELGKAIKSGANEISWEKLDDFARRFPNGAVLKRLGFLFETLVPNLTRQATVILESWQSDLTAGVVPLQPAGTVTGKITTRWRLKINAEVG